MEVDLKLVPSNFDILLTHLCSILDEINYVDVIKYSKHR
jgi:hypothetical protein